MSEDGAGHPSSVPMCFGVFCLCDCGESRNQKSHGVLQTDHSSGQYHARIVLKCQMPNANFTFIVCAFSESSFCGSLQVSPLLMDFADDTDRNMAMIYCSNVWMGRSSTTRGELCGERPLQRQCPWSPHHGCGLSEVAVGRGWPRPKRDPFEAVTCFSAFSVILRPSKTLVSLSSERKLRNEIHHPALNITNPEVDSPRCHILLDAGAKPGPSTLQQFLPDLLGFHLESRVWFQQKL